MISNLPNFLIKLLTIAGAFLVIFCASASAKEINIGVLSWNGEAVAIEQWQKLSDKLQAKLPQHQIKWWFYDIDTLTAKIKAGQLDFVITNPGHYVVLEAKYQVSRIATQIIKTSVDSVNTVGSAVIVLNNRQDINSLSQLKNKKIAAVAQSAFGGYQVILAELMKLGINPEDNDVEILFTGYPMEKVLNFVEMGKADAGIIRSCMLENLIKNAKVPPDKYRVLSNTQKEELCQSSSPNYPGWAFAAAVHTPPDLSAEILIALLLLNSELNNDEIWGVPADYSKVHKMLMELKIAPYEYLRELDFKSQLQKYYFYLGIIITLIIFGALDTFRVKLLIKRRTKELTTAIFAKDELEENIQQEKIKMEHLSRLSILGEMSGMLAHELNQPLATINNYAKSIKLRLLRSQLSPEVLSQAANEIESESQRAASILESIRNFTRKRTQQKNICNISVVVGDTVKMFCKINKYNPEIKIIDTLPKNENLVNIDILQIQQVLFNLLKNATDAQSENKINKVIEVGINIVEFIAEDHSQNFTISKNLFYKYIKITIRDFGCGISNENKKRIFEPFFTTKTDGMGLGLSICKTIIEAHSGELNVTTPTDGINQGMCFYFTLPLSTNN